MTDFFFSSSDTALTFEPALAASSNEPNDSMATATLITDGTHSVSGTGIDWYRVETISGQMNLTMTPTTGDLGMILYNSAGQAIAANFQNGTTAETISHLAATAGTYYIQVINPQYPGGSGAQPPAGLPLNYTLMVDLPEAVIRGPNDPGETMATAHVITEGTRTITGTGLDWMSFQTGPGVATLTLDTLAQNLNFEIYNSAGTVLTSGVSTGAATSISVLATATDTFYVRVLDPVYPNGTPNGVDMRYTLTLDLPDGTFSKLLDFGPSRSASIGVYDINNDGQDEIFVGTSKLLDAQGNEVMPAGLIAMQADGTILWTKTFDAAPGIDPKTGKTYETTSVSTAPVFSDVNGDGVIDIIVGLGADNKAEFDSVGQPGDQGGIYALDANGNTLWSFQTRDSFGDDNRSDGVFGAPVVFDIDGDGVREVIFASWDHYIYVLDGRNGALEKQADMHDTAGASPTVVDLNGDGLFEIIMPSDITDNLAAGLPTQGGVLHVFNNQLVQTVAGWNGQIADSTQADFRGKFDAQSMWSTAQVADLDRDGTLEVIVGTGNFFQDSRGEYIKVWNADGSLRMTLETDGRTFAAPLVADLDGDGSPEIIAGTISGNLHVWKADGTPVFDIQLAPYGLPAGSSIPVVRTPIAVDVNGDGKLEIVVSAGPQIMVISSTGQVLSSVTKPELITLSYEGSPVIRDIDGDGKLDFIAGGHDTETGQAVVYRFENIFDVTGEARTAKYQGHQNLNNVQDFVGRFYETILGREADAGGLNLWTDLLHTGINSGADVAFGFVFSPEFTNRNTSNQVFVETLYSAFFNRPADAGGLAGWLAVLDGGGSRDQVLSGFTGSQEFIRLSASFGIRAENLTGVVSDAAVVTGGADSDFLRGNSANQTIFDQGSVTESALNEADIYGQVYRLYLATLGRAPDPGGFVGWSEALTNGTIQLAQTAGAFVGSQEFSNVYGSLTDAQFIGLLYNNVLGRTAADAEIQAWLAEMNQGVTRANVVLGFSESTEFRNGTNGKLDAFMRITNVAWNDVIEGGAGDDTMNGGIGSDTFVFRSSQVGSDVINGFEPWDNLQLSAFGFKTAAEAMAHMVQEGADVVFNAAGQTIRFTNMLLSDMARARYNLS